jgi:hypothetical protein
MKWRKFMWIAWPSFLVAGVLEMLVFSMVDPHDLHGWSGQTMTLSRQALYTGAFFAFWGVAMVSSALTLLLAQTPSDSVGPRADAASDDA